MNDLPDIALSIMQPWSFLIVHGRKDIENRDWRPSNPGLKFRGPVAIHAGKKFDDSAMDDLAGGIHPVTGEASFLGWSQPSLFIDLAKGMSNGGIVGVAEIVDVVTESDSEWFVGPYGLVLRNARPVDFIPCNGAMGFFKWKGRAPV